MKFTKYLTKTVVALTVLIPTLSFAAPMTLTLDTSATAGVEYTFIDGGGSDTDGLENGQLNALVTVGLSGWLIAYVQLSNSDALAGAELLQSNVISFSKDPGIDSTLTITSTVYDLTSQGVLDSYNDFSKAGTTGNISAEVFIDTTNTGTSFVSLGASVQNSPVFGEQIENLTGLQLLDSGLAYAVRIVQTFTATGTQAKTIINVPEPSIVSLFVFGLAALAFTSRRRKQLK